jgi:predicted nuclease of predicted toxin-antitoxin system
VKFKIDENLPVEAADVLNNAGFDAVTVREQNLGGADDPPVYEACRRELRTLVTLDKDFSNLKTYPPKDGPGIVVMRLIHQDKPYVLDVLNRLVPLFAQEPVSGTLWIVEDFRVRIRE